MQNCGYDVKGLNWEEGLKKHSTLIVLTLSILLGSSPAFAENEIWTYADIQGVRPYGRICHTAVHDFHNDRMVVYAGSSHSQTLGDLWQLDSDSLIWTQLYPQNSGPLFLRSHCAVFNPADTSLVLFGGVEYPGGYISDELWVLNLNSLLWTEIQPSGLWPPPTRCNYATYWPEAHKMVMFGGRIDEQRYNTTWLLDLDTFTWELVSYQNAPPAPREGSPVLIIQGTSTMFVFGGWIQDQGYCNELWTLELISGIWTQHFPDPPHPVERGYCPLIYDKENNRALFFSGYLTYSGQGLNDLWQISLDSLQYAELFPSGSIPSPRGRFTTVVGGFAGHKATIFGGADNYQEYFNDVYFLDWDNIVKVESDFQLPDGIITINCYPNPFNETAIIRFNPVDDMNISIAIYNILGRKIATLLEGQKRAGEHTVTWDASEYPSGVYFARLETEDSAKSIKMILLK